MTEPCIKEEKIGGLLESKENFEAFMEDIRDNHLTSIYKKLDEIKDKMSSRRPSWSVAIVITFLSTLVGILLTSLIQLLWR